MFSFNHLQRILRNYGLTELRNHGTTELWRNQNFFLFLPAGGLAHLSGCGKGHSYGCKACFNRQSDDAGHRCDESASIPQKVFLLFFSNFQR